MSFVLSYELSTKPLCSASCMLMDAWVASNPHLPRPTVGEVLSGEIYNNRQNAYAGVASKSDAVQFLIARGYHYQATRLQAEISRPAFLSEAF